MQADFKNNNEEKKKREKKKKKLNGCLQFWPLGSSLCASVLIFQAEIYLRPARARHLCPSLPEDGVMDAIGVAMILLGLSAASCCI